MCLDHLVFVTRKVISFIQYRIGNRNLAEVVQKSAEADSCDGIRRKTRILRQQARKLADSPEMTAGIRVTRLHHRSHDKKAL